MLQCINVKLKLKFAIELHAVYLRGITYLWTPLFGMIPVLTLFVVCAWAVSQSFSHITVQDVLSSSQQIRSDFYLPKLNKQ